MAIFGDLVTMSTPDVLKMLGSRTGKLHIWSASRRQYELHLQQGAVCYFREDGVSVKDKLTLQKSLVELFKLRQGEFDFGPTPATVLTHEVHMTRQEVWQLLATTEVEGEAAEVNAVTNKTTRFKLKGGSPTTTELPTNLQVFLQRSRTLLAAGCSASELAEVVKLPVSLVQLYFIRLRSLDIIMPVRAYATNYGGYNGGSGGDNRGDYVGDYGDGYSGDYSSRGGSGASHDAGNSVGLLEQVSGPVYQPATTAITKAAWSPRQASPSTARPTTASRPQPSAAVSPRSQTPQSQTPQPSTQSAPPKRNFFRRLLSVLSFGGKR